MIADLQKKLIKFNDERAWQQFHSPKNLAIGISVEANELLEIFTWLSELESNNLTPKQIERLEEEVGDITIQLLNFCHSISLDPIECAERKLEINRKKYPIDKSFGSSKKYDEF